MADAALVLLEIADGVATLTLNRPERRNAITGALVEQALAAVAQLGADPAIRVFVLTGAGDAFCSGMDLAEPVKPDELTFMRRVAQLCLNVHDLSIPTIAKVRGAAVGFGANLALCCDLVVAGRSAYFGEIFARRGLSLDGGGSWSLPRRVGLFKAKEMAFFGDQVNADDAALLGLVNRSLDDDDLDGFVQEWTRRLACGPRRALSIIKASLNASFESSFAQAVEAESIAQALNFRSPEAREGFAAFVEKRDPDFSGI